MVLLSSSIAKHVPAAACRGNANEKSSSQARSKNEMTDLVVMFSHDCNQFIYFWALFLCDASRKASEEQAFVQFCRWH
jgi:hypothetical protein